MYCAIEVRRKIVFIFYSIHYPRPDQEDLLIESMHSFGELMRTQPGLLFVAPYPFKNPDNGTVMGVTVWEAQETFQAAMKTIADLCGPGPSPDWAINPTEVYRLNSAR
jgi:hypothetical protein